MHSELSPLFHQMMGQYAQEMYRLREEHASLSTAAVSEHINTVAFAHVGSDAVRVHAAAGVEEALMTVGTQLLVLHLEQIEHSAEANRARMHHTYTETMHGIRLKHAHIGTAMEVALLRERHKQHLAYNSVFARAADASWSRERHQLLAEVHGLTDTRQRTADRIVALAEQQTNKHYEGMAQQADAWAEAEAAEATRQHEMEVAVEKRREEEPARTRAAQAARQRRLLENAGGILARRRVV